MALRLIQLNMKVGSAKTVKKGLPELKTAGLITDTASGEPTLTDKGHKTFSLIHRPTAAAERVFIARFRAMISR